MKLVELKLNHGTISYNGRNDHEIDLGVKGLGCILEYVRSLFDYDFITIFRPQPSQNCTESQGSTR